jgi:hypothetical protein
MRAADDLTLEAFRRSRRRLRRLDRLAALIGYGFLFYVLYVMTLGRHVDAFYLAPFCFGTFTNLCRIVLWKVRAVPAAVLALVADEPARRARAHALIEAHRAEILGATEIEGLSISDSEPATWPLDAIAERVRGRVHWGRIAFYVGLVWGLAFVATVVAVLLYVPETERL